MSGELGVRKKRRAGGVLETPRPRPTDVWFPLPLFSSFLDSDCFESSDGAATDRHLAGSHHVNERAREESNDPRVAAARSAGCSAAAATGIAE